MTKWTAMYTQDSYNYSSLLLTNFMDWVMIMMFSILILVLWTYTGTLFTSSNSLMLDHKWLEFLWTISPLGVLLSMASMSMKALYTEEGLPTPPTLSLKITGHQWYWTYNYPDFNLEFDSYMKEWESQDFRLLDCDNRVILPTQVPIRMSVTSADVIHSWTIPSLGIKMDAMPGRINSTTTESTLPGIMYGQCSELCGVNHSFMPITIEFTTISAFKSWVNTMLLL
uniref:Cytochrome c oxidase subunit 2 n=1 Tax=Trichinella murrelli TaxID=144512 RepID=I3W946_9BILA|nr:cytochrome c oxidase subunit II [Trichinella murrelli]AFK93092.1 cytochrome c oxidase subunit II [Trichinella murrelli]AIW56981.1 cytochrome c oxidase subunit II [Trichinella murrelli]